MARVDRRGLPLSTTSDLAAEVVRIGGSALMRSGGSAKACALVDRRLQRRPSPRDARWRRFLTA